MLTEEKKNSCDLMENSKLLNERQQCDELLMNHYDYENKLVLKRLYVICREY